MLSKLIALLPSLFSALHLRTSPPDPTQPPSADSHPAYLLAAGTIGLGVYLIVQGQLVLGAAAVAHGLTTAGILHGVGAQLSAALDALAASQGQTTPIVIPPLPDLTPAAPPAAPAVPPAPKS